MAVRSEKLTGVGFAVTLTMKDLPGSPEELAEAFDAFHAVCTRNGLVRGHWVTEDQERRDAAGVAHRVPHFHLALYFDVAPELAEAIAAGLIRAWVRIAGPWGALEVAQHVAPIVTGTGWAQYCAKHAARSVRHSQRDGLPDGWDHTGRLWGHWGDWPIEETRIEIDRVTFAELRRYIKAWRRSDADKALRSAQRAFRAARTADGLSTAAHHVRAATGRCGAVRRHYGPRVERDPSGHVTQADLRRARSVSRSIGMREWVPEALLFQMLLHILESRRAPAPLWGSTGRPDRTWAGVVSLWWGWADIVEDIDEDTGEIRAAPLFAEDWAA
jgi:hypothetical protein